MLFGEARSCLEQRQGLGLMVAGRQSVLHHKALSKEALPWLRNTVLSVMSRFSGHKKGSVWWCCSRIISEKKKINILLLQTSADVKQNKTFRDNLKEKHTLTV